MTRKWMQRAIALSILAGVAVFSIVAASTPRKSPEFAIQMPDGSQTLLSSFRGKVVVVEFLFTTCPHCQTSSQMLSKLHKEFGARGFQPVGVAFNPMAMMLVPDFVKANKVSFPVGVSAPEAVHSYLQHSALERLMVPQVVVIDRQGTIRASTPASGDEKLTSESHLRSLIESLLKEPAGGASKAAGASKKKS